jgi:hypothetical protein
VKKKNTKRIDPRYFLDETVHRDELEEAVFGDLWDKVKQKGTDIKQSLQQQGADVKQGIAAAKAERETGSMGTGLDPLELKMVKLYGLRSIQALGALKVQVERNTEKPEEEEGDPRQQELPFDGSEPKQQELPLEEEMSKEDQRALHSFLQDKKRKDKEWDKKFTRKSWDKQAQILIYDLVETMSNGASNKVIMKKDPETGKKRPGQARAESIAIRRNVRKTLYDSLDTKPSAAGAMASAKKFLEDVFLPLLRNMEYRQDRRKIVKELSNKTKQAITLIEELREGEEQRKIEDKKAKEAAAALKAKETADATAAGEKAEADKAAAKKAASDEFAAMVMAKESLNKITVNTLSELIVKEIKRRRSMQ